MQIINTTNLNEARKQIQKIKKENLNEIIAVLSQDEEFNRKVLEIKGINLFVINENLNQKDYMKQRNSGLNEPLCKLAAKNDIKIGVQLDEIVRKEEIEKARSLARLKQNIMLCKKAKTQLVFLGKNIDKMATRALLSVLGASTSQASEIEIFKY